MKELELNIEELEERIAPGSFATEFTLTATSPNGHGTSTEVCSAALGADGRGAVNVTP